MPVRALGVVAAVVAVAVVGVGVAAPKAVRLVGSPQIRDGSVLLRDLHPSLRARVLERPGQVTVTPTPVAPAVVQVTGPELLLGAGGVPAGGAAAQCPAGGRATGAGFTAVGDVTVASSTPVEAGWSMGVRWDGPGFLQGRVAVTVVCLVG